MRIGTILHKVGEKGETPFLDKVEALALSDVNIILGPENSMTCGEGMSALSQVTQVYDRMKGISAEIPEVLFAPGTISCHYLNEGMINVAPVFLGGELYRVFLKKKNRGDSERAALTGDRFLGRSCSILRDLGETEDFVDFRGRRIAVSICGDQGVNRVAGADVELVPSYDNRAGFYQHLLDTNWKRHIVVCDGLQPTVRTLRYDPNVDPNVEDVFPDVEDKNFKIFDINV